MMYSGDENYGDEVTSGIPQDGLPWPDTRYFVRVYSSPSPHVAYTYLVVDRLTHKTVKSFLSRAEAETDAKQRNEVSRAEA